MDLGAGNKKNPRSAAHARGLSKVLEMKRDIPTNRLFTGIGVSVGDEPMYLDPVSGEVENVEGKSIGRCWWEMKSGFWTLCFELY